MASCNVHQLAWYMWICLWLFQYFWYKHYSDTPHGHNYPVVTLTILVCCIWHTRIPLHELEVFFTQDKRQEDTPWNILIILFNLTQLYLSGLSNLVDLNATAICISCHYPLQANKICATTSWNLSSLSISITSLTLICLSPWTCDKRHYLWRGTRFPPGSFWSPYLGNIP